MHMKWSIGIMVVGILLVALGFAPLVLGNISIGTLESAAAFFTVGIFIFLVGFALRRFRKAFEKPKSRK